MKTKKTSSRRASVEQLFLAISVHGDHIMPGLSKTKITMCSQADAEHKKSSRQYAHYNHHANTVCYAPAMDSLGLEWQIGILAHELGHAAADLQGLDHHSEEDANRIGSAILGSTVIFKGPKRLEWAGVPSWMR